MRRAVVEDATAAHRLKGHPAFWLFASECLIAACASAFVPIHVHLLCALTANLVGHITDGTVQARLVAIARPLLAEPLA